MSLWPSVGLIIFSGDTNVRLRQEVKQLKEYVEDVFTDQNDINGDTRMQLELINQTLVELQVRSKEQERKNIWDQGCETGGLKFENDDYGYGKHFILWRFIR